MRNFSGILFRIPPNVPARQVAWGAFVLSEAEHGRIDIARSAALISNAPSLVRLVEAFAAGVRDAITAAVADAIQAGQLADVPRPLRHLSTRELGDFYARAQEWQDRGCIEMATFEMKHRERDERARIDRLHDQLKRGTRAARRAHVQRQDRQTRIWVRAELSRRRESIPRPLAHVARRSGRRGPQSRPRAVRRQATHGARAPTASDGSSEPPGDDPPGGLAELSVARGLSQPCDYAAHVPAGPGSCASLPRRAPVKSVRRTPPKAGGAARSLLRGASAAAFPFSGPAAGAVGGAP